MSRYISKTKKSVVIRTVGGGAPSSSSSARSSTPLISSATSRASASTSSLTAPVIADGTDRRMSEFWAAEDVCPLCKSDRQLNPKLRLMVSRCYHKMCESCIDRIFSLGPEPCPFCQQILRKAHFTGQTFEDLSVQKEVVIRQRIAKCFNKRPEDFNDLRGYNDYLEEVEVITFNLINAVDLITTESRIKAYEAENRELIASNVTRQARETEDGLSRAEEEQRAKEEAKREYERLDEVDRLGRDRERKAVLESLESSTVSTSKILSRARQSASERAIAHAAPLVPSLRYLANLATSDYSTSSTTPVDFLADLNTFDAYESLFQTRSTYVGEDASESQVGGFVKSEVWTKAIREAVAGMWDRPLSDDDDGDASRELRGSDVDIIMA